MAEVLDILGNLAMILIKNNMYKRCEADYGAVNCEESDLVVYPKCRSGFHAVGCCVCSPSCPDGMNDIGISCGKETYGRGVGVSRLKCPDNKEEDAHLCYNKCASSWYGVGPICWQSCTSSISFDCGVMYTVDESTCVDELQQLLNRLLNLEEISLLVLLQTILSKSFKLLLRLLKLP